VRLNVYDGPSGKKHLRAEYYRPGGAVGMNGLDEDYPLQFVNESDYIIEDPANIQIELMLSLLKL